MVCPTLHYSNLTVVILEETEGENMHISSTYMVHDRPAPQEELQPLTSAIATNKPSSKISKKKLSDV